MKEHFSFYASVNTESCLLLNRGIFPNFCSELSTTRFGEEIVCAVADLTLQHYVCLFENFTTTELSVACNTNIVSAV